MVNLHLELQIQSKQNQLASKSDSKSSIKKVGKTEQPEEDDFWSDFSDDEY